MTHVWEPYLPGTSPIHRLDPRLKLIAALGTVMAASLVPTGQWWPLLALAALLAAALALSRLPLSALLARTMPALPFVLLAALSVPFARPGDTLWSPRLGPLTLSLTREGLLALSTILARAWLSLWAATLLVASTSLPALQQALRALHVPAILCSTIALMIRYLFVLVDEASRLMAARASRTAGNRLTLRGRIRVLGGMIGSLLVRSIDRAERIHAAMLARGYDGTLRTLQSLHWRRADTVALLLYACALVALLLTTL